MKKKHNTKVSDELRAEYDLSALKGGIRGKYAKQFATGTNIVVLSPENAKAFPNSEAVNKALAKLIKPARNRTNETQSRKSKTGAARL